MDSIVFRPAGVLDARLWAQTRQKAWASTYRGIYPDSWIDQYDYDGKEQKDRQSLSDPSLLAFLVMDGEECAGYFSYGPTGTGEFYLKNLYLLPGYQGRGLGRRIFAQILQDCARMGYPFFTATAICTIYPPEGSMNGWAGDWSVWMAAMRIGLRINAAMTFP